MGRTPSLPRFELVLTCGFALLAALPAAAQNAGLVVRDGTLGSGAPAVVAPGIDNLGSAADYLISAELGEQRGGNLFHSFSLFSIGSGERATFTGQGAPDPGAIDNVISRVTGGAVSQIDGTLHSTIPGAAVWLLNPSGVAFGAGARLDVPGSFHASTGDYLGFDGAGLVRFYSDPSQPSVLAMAEPRAFGFLSGSAAAAIALEPGAAIALEPGAALAVDAGNTLELVAGTLALTGAQLAAPGGHVRLDAVGQIALSQSLVDVGRPNDTPGTISIRGGAIVIEQGSKVLAENESAAPSANQNAPGPGQIAIEAEESILVDQGLLSVSTHAAGNAGTIELTGPSVILQHGPGVDGSVPQELDFGARAETTSSGTAGAIRIDAHDLIVRDGVGVSAGAIGGPGGLARGASGTVEIAAHSVEVSDRSYIVAASWGSLSPGGTVSIDLGDDGSLLVDDKRPGDPDAYAWILTHSESAAGTIEIEAGSVVVRGGHAAIASHSGRASTSAVGGTIAIDAGSVVVSGGTIEVSASGAGNAGAIAIAADSVVVDGGGVLATAGDPPWVPGGSAASGDAGRIEIEAGTLRVSAGGLISATSWGAGAAGDITVVATESVVLDQGGLPRRRLVDRLFPQGTSLGFDTTIVSASWNGGPVGTVRLRAPEITLLGGAFVATTTLGGTDAGDVVLAGDRIRILGGSFVDSTKIATDAAAGTVTLTANESIEVSGRSPDGEVPSRVGTLSLATGAPGAVFLQAPLVLVDGGLVATTSLPSLFTGPAGGSGDIAINASDLIVRGGGRIDASSFGLGAGGAIHVAASAAIVVEGAGSGIASRTGGSEQGGDVVLQAPRIEIAGGGEVSARSRSGLGELSEVFEPGFPLRLPRTATGDAGSVTLIADELWLRGGTITTDATNVLASNGGGIAIRARDRVHLIGGTITASVNNGVGGNITIDPDFVILEDGSNIVSNAGGGSGGTIQITAQNVFAFPGSVISADADPDKLGVDGTVEIHTPDVDLSGTLTALPAAYLDASSLLHARCAARRSGERSGSFTVRGGGIAPAPDAPLTSTSFAAAAQNAAGAPTASAVISSGSPPAMQQLARLDRCD